MTCSYKDKVEGWDDSFIMKARCMCRSVCVQTNSIGTMGIVDVSQHIAGTAKAYRRCIAGASSLHPRWLTNAYPVHRIGVSQLQQHMRCRCIHSCSNMYTLGASHRCVAAAAICTPQVHLIGVSQLQQHLHCRCISYGCVAAASQVCRSCRSMCILGASHRCVT